MIWYNHRYIQWSYSVLCTDFTSSSRKTVTFFSRVPLYLYQGRLEFYGLRNFESTDCWPQRRFGCSSEIAPWRFLEKKPWGFWCFPILFPKNFYPKNKHEKKKCLYFFWVPKSLNSNCLTPPKKKRLTTWKGLFFFFGGGRQTRRPYHRTPFFGKALWRLRRHLCPDHHLSTGHHPPENAGVTPWYFEHGWLENGPIDDVFFIIFLLKMGDLQLGMLVYQTVI